MYVLYCGDIAPDHAGFADGVFPAYAKGDSKRGADDWGAVAAWAWGLSRAVDYLATDTNIDRDRIAVVGHRLRDEAVIGGIKDRGVKDAIQLQQAGDLVEFVLVGTPQRNFDHGGESRGHTRVDIVPGVKG